MSDYTFNSIAAVKINSHRLRNTLLILLLITLIIILFSITSASNGLKAIYSSDSQEVYPFSKNTLPSFSSISFFSSDKKVLLKGWFFRKADSNKAIIFIHDYSKNRLVFGEETERVINICLDKGYSVLLYDQRNSGNVVASRTTLGLNETLDLEGAVSYAKDLDMRQIYLVGFGAGANSVLNATPVQEVSAWVLDSPYYNFNTALKYILKLKEEKTIFYTKSFIKLFMRIFDRVKIEKYSKEHFTDVPPTIFTRSGFSFLDTGDEKKLYDLLVQLQPKTILAAISLESDPIEYMDMVFNFFDEYSK